MCKTRHFSQRLSQRGIKSEVVNILLQFGETKGDKLVLNRDCCLYLANVFSRIKGTLTKMAEAGGHTLVVGENDDLITIYRTGSFDKRLARKSSKKAKKHYDAFDDMTSDDVNDMASDYMISDDIAMKC